MPDTLAQNRFNAVRREIDRQPCICPLRPVIWMTVEHFREQAAVIGGGWELIGNGVYYHSYRPPDAAL